MYRHYPIGLLYDLLTSSVNTLSATTKDPWPLTLHLSNFPTTTLLRSLPPPGSHPDSDIGQDFYMSTLKESDFVRHGSVKRVMGLSKKDQEGLWESLKAGQGERFWEVNRGLILGISSSSATTNNGGGNGGTSSPAPGDVGMVCGVMPRSVPLKVYVGYDKPILREAIPPRDSASGRDLTLLDALHQCTPAVISKQIQAIVHGISVPLETPVLWLSRNMSYADNFLHVVILVK
ncbi:autophagy protein 5 [Chytridiales sp. JEL 0842]|nr:autophagy protein 5 [Chytridiales sp. JEL 0842]